ncbi:MAG: pseudouridine-5'-phosphate glycosidase [Phycisphaerales bacterium]
MPEPVFRAGPCAVALETTLLVHGVPASSAPGLHRELRSICRDEGAEPALVGLVSGRPTVGVSEDELALLLEQGTSVPKANSANLGVLCHWGSHGATTVSATMELASGAGVHVFSTGGLGGVHKGYGCHLDISADLGAFTRFPVAVVASGVKSLLDVASTREALETLGVPVIGYRTDAFPAFYTRDSGQQVDARFDDAETLAAYLRYELDRTGRGVLVCNPIPENDELDPDAFAGWLERAEDEAEDRGVTGRGVTPFLLARLHELSGGKTLEANLALVRSNVRLGARLAKAMHG